MKINGKKKKFQVDLFIWFASVVKSKNNHNNKQLIQLSISRIMNKTETLILIENKYWPKIEEVTILIRVDVNGYFCLFTLEIPLINLLKFKNKKQTMMQKKTNM